MKVIVSARARADALNAFSYLFDRNPAAAERALERIERKIEQLREFPFVGVVRPRVAAGVRVVVAGTYLILYKVETEALLVLRIIDGRMDVDVEFRR